MVKAKKKRNKAYTGEDAATAAPVIRRYEAVERNKLSQWWYEKKKIVKPIGIAALVLAIVIWLISELIRIIF
ncbi:MAG TPA: hypothetical protein VFZ48_04925 [Candidatus Saccharimonadales bacterium]